jgi:uncharacterized protein with PIN domain
MLEFKQQFSTNSGECGRLFNLSVRYFIKKAYMSDAKDIKDTKTLLQLQAIVIQSTKNMQMIQKQLEDSIEQSQQNADYFIERVSEQLLEKIIKPLKSALNDTQNELANIAKQSQQEFGKMRLYKSFIIHIALFILLGLTCYILIWFEKKELEEFIAANQRQITFLKQHGKKIHLNESPLQGKNYACARIYSDQPIFKGADGETYALVKP